MGAEYPHKKFTDQLLVDLITGARKVKPDEAAAYFTAQLYEHCVTKLLPEWSEKLKSDFLKEYPECLPNYQTMISVLVAVAQGMGRELGIFLQEEANRQRQLSLEQASICLKRMGTDAGTGAVIACSLPANHGGQCA